MTMKLTKIDPRACKQIREAVSENLAEIMDELGLKLSFKSGTYSHNKFGVKIEFVLADADPAKDDFKFLAAAYGVKPEDHGKTVTIQGEQYRIVGINTRARRFPFNVERIRDGAAYKFPERSICTALGRSTRPPIFKGEVETI